MPDPVLNRSNTRANPAIARYQNTIPCWHRERAAGTVSSVNDVSLKGQAAELMAALGAVNRAARRAIRHGTGAVALPPGRSELLRLVARHPGLSVAEAAVELGLAPNSVSTMVGKLTAESLITRERHADDGRSARLTATAAGTERIAHWRDLRADLAARALAGLDPADRRLITEATGALGRLAKLMEEP